MKQQSTAIMQATQYSVFPALLVVQEEDSGRKTIHPIPLEMRTLLNWLWLLLATSLRCFSYASILFRIGLEIGWLVEDVRAGLRRLSHRLEMVRQQITLEIRLGLIISRNLAGVLLDARGGV